MAYEYEHLNRAQTLTLKPGAGVLHAIIVNTTANGTITLYDNTAGSGKIIAQLKASIAENTYAYDLKFITGLTVVTAAASDITITYT